MAHTHFGGALEAGELSLDSIYAFLRTVLAAYCREGKKKVSIFWHSQNRELYYISRGF